MRVVLTSIVIAVLLAAGVSFALYRTQKPVYEVDVAPTTVRIGDPGHNLVGPDWSGLPKPAQSTTRISQRE